ncbi:hypothetical protein ACH9L7_13100 [Haloferax sp. S1W]|uniref:hypothetical protein n=1 Tax=Haloferax sp. S1W TaxID=3377110 RepID=UPI0037CB13FE
MDDIMRRTLLRRIAGSTIATGAFAGSAAAHESSDDKQPGLGLDIEKQEVSVRDNQLGSVWSTDPVKEMRKFLRKEHDIKIVPNDLDTYLVKPSDKPSDKQNGFLLHRTPLSNETDLEADFVIRDHEDGTYTSSTVGIDVYKSGPSIVGNDDIKSQDPDLKEYNIITGQEWTDQLAKISNNSIGTYSSCDLTWDFEFGTDAQPPKWVCEAVFIVGGVTLAILPEPTSTAAGVATLSIYVTSGGCALTQKIEDNTEIDLGATVTLCMNSSCSLSGFAVDCDFDFKAYLA